MAINLPQPIADYFAADRNPNARAVAECFTPKAVVKDEGHTHAGQDAIGRWKSASSSKYTYTVEPLSIADEDDRIVVTSHLVGNFPGSPTDLRYCFVLEDQKIAELEVIA